jgi:hypothetical protein
MAFPDEHGKMEDSRAGRTLARSSSIGHDGFDDS